MNATRIWTFGAGVVIIAILVLGWLLGVAPLLQQAAAAEADRAAVETQNATLRGALEGMKDDFARLGEIEAELAELQSSIPAEEQLDYFARGVEHAARANGVHLDSFIAAEMPFLGGATADGAVALTGTGGIATTTAAGTVYAIPITIGLEGSVDGMLGTLHALQLLPRLFLVNGTAVTVPGPSSGEPPSATITGYVFILTDRALAPTPEDAAVAPTPENSSNYEVPDLDAALPEWLGGEGTAPSTVTGQGETPAPTPSPSGTPAP